MIKEFSKLLIIFFVCLNSCKKGEQKEKKLVVKLKEENNQIFPKKLKLLEKKIKQDSLIFELNNHIIYFLEKKNECWDMLKIKDKVKNQVFLLNTDKSLCFESNSLDDFSPNQKYLILHSLERGILNVGDKKESIEKYYCIFLDIKNRKLSKKNQELFCTGEWNSLNEWIIDEEDKYNPVDFFYDIDDKAKW